MAAAFRAAARLDARREIRVERVAERNEIRLERRTAALERREAALDRRAAALERRDAAWARVEARHARRVGADPPDHSSPVAVALPAPRSIGTSTIPGRASGPSIPVTTAPGSGSAPFSPVTTSPTVPTGGSNPATPVGTSNPLPANVAQPLDTIYQEYENGTLPTSPSQPGQVQIVGNDVGVMIRVNNPGDFDADLAAAVTLGMQVNASNPSNDMFAGLLPIAQLPAAAQLSDSPTIVPVYSPMAT
jgi:hypothetical protein